MNSTSAFNEPTPIELERMLRSNKPLLTLLRHIVNQYEQDELNSEIRAEDYASSSWAYKQADRNGARRAYKRITQLLDIRDPVTKEGS